ncbi:MAG TPA: PAS domain S-box protein [Pyrinomonadaceae bacterium]|jgi:diguanylate cyclase (GGDEF)-like protein/PAS domain S-box-containing protein
MSKNKLPAPKKISRKAQKANNFLTEFPIQPLPPREQECSYRSFIENLPVMFYAVEPFPPFKPIYVSPAFAALGYQLEDWQNSLDMWIRTIHPQDRKGVLLKTEAAMQKGEEIDYEYRLIAQDGTIRWVRDRGSFIRGESGEIVYWQGIIFDITACKQAQASVRESEERHRQMFEKNQSIKLLIDAETGSIVDANPAACKFYGYGREEFRTMKITDINALPEKQIKREMRRAKNERRNCFVFPHRLSSGEIRDVEVHSSPLFSQGKNLLYSIIYDITERKRAEESLIESERQYRNVFENANDLIYVHDLDGNYISVNQASERLFGYKREEALQMNVSQIIVPEHLEFTRQMLKEKISGAKQTAYEVDCITKNGRRVTLEVNSSIIYKNGKPTGVQGIARDITTRKRDEKTLKESVEQYRDLFENANDLIYTHDLHGNFTSLNRAGEIITGYAREEALKMNISEVVAPEFLERARQMTARKVSGEAPMPYELEIIAKDGHRVPLELSSRLIFHNGLPIGVQGIGRDITERKRDQEALKLSERRYRFLSESIMHQVWTATPEGDMDYINRRALEYFGLTQEQMFGKGWQDVVHPDDLPECLERWNYSLRTGNYFEVEFRLQRADGTYRWHTARASAGKDSGGKIVKWFGTNTDIDDKRMAEEKLNHYALHDTLTNLPNRTEFINHLKTAIKRSVADEEFRFAVLFLDLDRFKVINDSLGHLIGDKLLIGIARRLKSCVRPGDVVARLGGDEFTILLNKTGGAAEVAKVAERLQTKLSKPFMFNNYEVFTTASIGVILSDSDHTKPEEYLRDADAAMYRAKESGKARYEIFDSEMHVRNINLLQLETDLRYAVERNELEVFYQPIVCLETGKIREFEALIRWRHPKHGLISPSEFISTAEETGLIIPIGQWILSESCRQISQWHQRYPEFSSLSVSVNLSAKQLMHPSLTSQVQQILQKCKLEPHNLKLEVTESTVMENSETALGILSELRALGVSLSTDDFGTGYSSLSYLHRFPFQRMKIDRSFINRMDSDIKSEAIVRSILMLGQNLEIETVAEGIENEEQLWQLRSLGCPFGQGYLFSQPVNQTAAEKLLSEGLPFSFDSMEAPFSFADTKRRLIELDKIQ